MNCKRWWILGGWIFQDRDWSVFKFYSAIHGAFWDVSPGAIISLSKIFPVKNSNFPSSSLVAKSPVSKTRLFWSLLSSHLRFRVCFNLLSWQKLIFRLFQGPGYLSLVLECLLHQSLPFVCLWKYMNRIMTQKYTWPHPIKAYRLAQLRIRPLAKTWNLRFFISIVLWDQVMQNLEF